MSLLILADDLTGTADCGARCLASGLPATLFLKPPDPPISEGAIALTSDSRQLAPSDARERVSELLKPLVQVPGLQWYKKIDSTLRGNIGSELEAMLELLTGKKERSLAVICPAFPQQGRGLKDGYLCADGVPAHLIHLPELLAGQTRLPISAVSLDKVREGRESLVSSMTEAEAKGTRLLVVDGLNDEDLRAIVQAAKRFPDCLFCGSAGLVGILAAEYTRIHGRTGPKTEISHHTDGPTLAVIGSGCEMTHQQIRTVKQEHNIEVFEVSREFDCSILQRKLRTRHSDCLLHLPLPTEQIELEGKQARYLADHLARAALVATDLLQPGLFILSGGDTAISVLHQLEIERLQVVAELMPGIPLTKPLDSIQYQGMVILKPGSFGREDSLLELFQRGKHREN